MTPAEELRAAAALLREKADKATSGPWGEGQDKGFQPSVYGNEGQWVAECGPTRSIDSPDGKGDHDAAWIALMSPAVAEPLADWLETVSNNVRFEATVNGGRACLSVDQESALTFARAITKEVGP